MQKRLIFLLAILLFALPQSASAHPADMYFHTFTLNFSSNSVQILWEFVPGPMVTHVVWHDADLDGDEAISDAEAEAWIAPLLADFSLKLDETPLNFDLVAVKWANSMPQLRTGETPILIELHADFGTDTGELLLLNRYLTENSLSWFSINAADGMQISAPEQDNGVLKVQFSPGEGRQNWESGQPSIPPVVEALGLGETAEKAVENAENQQGILAILEGFLRTPNISPMLFLAALAIALILGALHALSPGHGKTIVAAYLIGSQGKAYHAIVLGILVTLTHTGSVFALGLATLSLSKYIMPDQLFPALELISGLLIVILGIFLLLPRIKTFLAEKKREKEPAIAKNVVKGESSTRLTISEEIREPGPEHNHDPSQFGYVPIPRLTRDSSRTNPLSDISWKSLIALGISGGLVPCPDAIAILLIAVTINKIAFGLGLIISFSLGLAIVLILIGIVMVQSKQIFARLQWFSKVSFIVPVISALVVLVLGVALSVSAIRKFPDGFTLFNKEESLKNTYITYLAIDNEYHKQLYLIPALGGEIRQITNGDTGVWNYSVSPAGDSLIYSAPDSGTGSELWFWQAKMSTPKRILHCPEESCSDALWSPNREQILYSRLNFGDEQAYLGIPSLWWLNLETLETQPLFQDSQLPGYNPRWSFDGNWLSYTSASPQEIQIYNLKSGEQQNIPTEIGSAVAWSPNSTQFLSADLKFVGEMYLSKISLYGTETKMLTPLPTEENFDDNAPSWSPDGNWISFSRGQWDLDSAIRGDQIWLIRADGRDAHPITSSPETTHGFVSWSPRGRFLLYRVYAVNATDAPWQIRIYDLKAEKEITVVAPGESPSWFLP